MKTILEYNNKNIKKIDSFEKIYIVCKHAKFAILELPFAGYSKRHGTKELIPMVYVYDDHNGEWPEYVLRDVYGSTSGFVYFYTFNRRNAQYIAEEMNRAVELRRSNVAGGIR